MLPESPLYDYVLNDLNEVREYCLNSLRDHFNMIHSTPRHPKWVIIFTSQN
jgi:hypothetical protein